MKGHRSKPCQAWLVAALAVACVAAGWLFMAAPASAAAPTQAQTHEVDYGETLSAIAARYGTTVAELIRLNKLDNPDLIVVGQVLVIPERGETPPATPQPSLSVTHIVQPGETLGTIARRYGASVAQLTRLNQLQDPNKIEVGQKLIVVVDLVALGADVLPAGPIEGARITPSPAFQGQTVTIVITASQPISLTATFDGREIPFVAEGSRHWALFGIHAMARSGYYPIRLTATTVVTRSTSAGSNSAPAPQTTHVNLGLFVVAGDFPVYDIVLEPSTGKSALLDSKLIRAEQARINELIAGRSGQRRWGSRLAQPLAAEFRRVTSTYGERRSYNGGPANSYHEGIDFGAPEGTPVYAAADGIVALADALDVRGNGILLDHGLGIFTGYWHLSEIVVGAGDAVKAGQLIAKVGTTGLSTGSHLHWELRVGSIAVDPMQWVDGPIL